MRVIVALLAAASIAQPSLAQPLEPGKPAGVKHARMTANHEALMIGAGVAIMTGVGIVVGGGSGAGITTGTVISSPNIIPATISTSSTG
jgi:hypothetical protein